MALVAEYQAARHDESLARLRRTLALRAMGAVGMSQRQIAEAVGLSQSAISQQLKFAPDRGVVDPELLIEAAAPILRDLAVEQGYSRLAVFGSVARGQARRDSDIDLLVESPPGTTSFGFIRFQRLLERILGRQVDLVDYGGLKPGLDDHILREAVLL